MRSKITQTALAVMAALCLPLAAQAEGKFYFPVGISYAQGIYDVANTTFDMYEDAGFDLENEFIIPVGLTLSPYYEFGLGADMGLGLGVTVGPTAFIVIQEEYYDYYEDWSDETRFSYIIPVGVDLRYSLFREKAVTPYIKVGFRYPIAGGDNISGSTIGAYGAIGVELWRNKAIGLGIEVGYDTSEVTVEGPSNAFGGSQEKDETYGGFMVTISAVF